MPLTKAHKARTRERIIDAAAARFRAQGFAGAGVDDIMRDAGLTRGGFYAHFPSKAALFAEVLGSRQDLLRRLTIRRGADARVLKAEGRATLRAYVAPENAARVGPACSLANLAVEAARADPRTRRRLGAVLERLADELARGEGAGRRPQVLAALAMAIGAVMLARGCRGTPTAAAVLGSVLTNLDAVLDR